MLVSPEQKPLLYAERGMGQRHKHQPQRYFNVTRQLIGYFFKNKRGCIINISSVSGLVGIAGQTNYCASKSGIIGFTRALAKEAAKLGIPVNCIAPGYIDTEMTRQLPEKHLEEIKNMIPSPNRKAQK
jgi:3-oxoacyl-[acyl-carrier protein] reductase